MAQSGYTPIQLYYSATTTNVPLAANLIAGEIAINTADGKLFYKDSSSVVQVIATKASAISSVNNNGVVYVNSSGQATTGTALTFDGTNFATTGTATATKLIPTGTSVTGNGMYLPAANALGLSTNGTNAVYINASQNVGIGTSSPVGRVDSLSNGYAAFVARSTGSGVGQSVAALTSIDSTASNYAAAIYAASAHAFYLFTTEVGRFDTNGNFAVGITTASGKIHSYSTTGIVGVYVNTTNNHGVYSAVAGTGYGIYGYSSGTAGVLGYDPTNTLYGVLGYSGYSLYCNGTAYIGGVVYPSDRRLKENDQTINNALSKVMQLRAVSFDWKAESSRGIQKGGATPDYGFIAQEVETVFPDLVTTATTPPKPEEITSPTTLEEQLGEHKVLDYTRFIPFLTAAIQEQQALITQLTDRIAALETK